MTPKQKTRRNRRTAVSVNLKVFDLSKAGTAMELAISERGERLGYLTIGRGSVTWKGANHSKGKRFGWIRFAAMMNRLAYGE